MADRVVGVTDSSGSSQTFSLTPRPPIRAFALSAGAAVLGMGMMVVWGMVDRPVALLVVALVLLLAGVALALAALVLDRRLRSSVVVGEETVTLIRGQRSDVLRWSEIDRVSLHGPRVLFLGKDGLTTQLVNPRSGADPQFLTVVAAIRAKLDNSRGYKNF